LNDREGNYIGRGAHDGADDQLSESALPLGLDVRAESIELDQQSAGETHDLGTQRRGLHAPRQALE
jgi:hypothetical protein